MGKLEQGDQKWQTANGDLIKIKDLDSQHLSNIYWYYVVIVGCQPCHEIKLEIKLRFKGKGPMQWEPLPIENEIEILRHRGLIKREDIWFAGKKIGSIKHLSLTHR